MGTAADGRSVAGGDSGRTVIRGGTVVTPAATRRADVAIAGERITAIGLGAGFETAVEAADHVIDAGGLYVLPGLIDAHVHFEEPGREDWEGWASGSAAAAAGGVTTVVDMPIDSTPPTITRAAFHAKADRARRSSVVDFALWGGLTPGSLDAMPELARCGVVGYKAFLSPTGVPDFPPVDAATLAAALRAAAALDLPVALHAEHPDHLLADPALPAPVARPARAEIAAVELAAPLAAQAGARLHLVHVSSAEAVTVARRWPGVTIETCPHYLILTERDAADPRALCAPPLRSADNRDRLWDAVLAGRVDWIASDHSPCPLEMKRGTMPWAGISGVQTTLPLLVSSGRLGLAALVQLLTAAAAHLRLPGKGTLSAGSDADIVLLDPAAAWELTAADLLVRHPGTSPFLGWPLMGQVVRTLVRGHTVFTLDCGIRGEHPGRLVRPSAHARRPVPHA